MNPELEITAPKTNWFKLTWRALAALPACYLAWLISCLFVQYIGHFWDESDFRIQVGEHIISSASAGAALAACLPRLKRTAGVIWGLLLMLRYAIWVPFIHLQQPPFDWWQTIIIVPCVFVGWCFVAFSRSAEVIRGPDGVEFFPWEKEVFRKT